MSVMTLNDDCATMNRIFSDHAPARIFLHNFGLIIPIRLIRDGFLSKCDQAVKSIFV